MPKRSIAEFAMAMCPIVGGLNEPGYTALILKPFQLQFDP